jgi:hypothetical protein
LGECDTYLTKNGVDVVNGMAKLSCRFSAKALFKFKELDELMIIKESAEEVFSCIIS